jgi:hypothetical protein
MAVNTKNPPDTLRLRKAKSLSIDAFLWGPKKGLQ